MLFKSVAEQVSNFYARQSKQKCNTANQQNRQKNIDIQHHGKGDTNRQGIDGSGNCQQKQFPEIVDFYLPPEGCSYRLAVVTIKKQYAGHAKRVMMGVWSFLRQFMYTKFVIVCDDDVNARDWNDVIWAITTRMDPARDTVLVENTPIDYLDFASPVSGLGSKMGLDATNKWPGETQREWGRPIKKDPDVVAHIDAIWDELAIFNNGKSA